MGNRYSKEEQERIKTLVTEGLTNREIATQLNRTEAAIRNQRHRMKLQADTKASLQSLLQEKKTLQTQVSNLRREAETMQARRTVISKILGSQEEVQNKRLTTALTRMKDRKPELFNITDRSKTGRNPHSRIHRVSSELIDYLSRIYSGNVYVRPRSIDLS